jgi:FKBP-type peptidyl-prolyl cis-trans isomerase 2
MEGDLDDAGDLIDESDYVEQILEILKGTTNIWSTYNASLPQLAWPSSHHKHVPPHHAYGL